MKRFEFGKDTEIKQEDVTSEDVNQVHSGTLVSSSLTELLSANKPIWVVNRTKEILGTPMFLILDIGGHKSEPIPPGPEPFCLSDKLSKKKIEECDDLFRLIDRKVLSLVDNEVAKDYYRTHPEAKETLNAKLQAFSYTTEGGGVRGFKDMLGKNVMKQFRAGVTMSAPTASTNKKIMPKLEWIIQGFEQGILDEEKFIVELRSILQDLEPQDILYIQRNEKVNAIYEKIKG